ncbi:MAG: peptide-binding protein [Pirellulaceae bacterium]
MARSRSGFWLLAGALVLVMGCRPASRVNESDGAAAASDVNQSESGDTAAAAIGDAQVGESSAQASDGSAKPFQLGDLVLPFTPPPLQEIDTTSWQNRPVVDALEVLREKQAADATRVRAMGTSAEVLELRNDSPEANERISSVLGRLPESDGEVDYNATFTRWLGSDIKSSNPILADSKYEFDVNGLTAFGLFSFDWNLQPFAVKEYVKSWQVSPDQMMDKVVMRDDATWSDGKPVTAHDVVFSFRLIMTSTVPVPAVRSMVDQIKWVEAYDDHTLVVFHKESLATNVWNLNFPVVPRHIYEQSAADDPTLVNSDYHVKYENEPVFGGPYKVTRRIRGQEIVLTRRDDWYERDGRAIRPKPFFREVRFRIIQEPSAALLALKAGDLDELEMTPEIWQTQSNEGDFYRHNTKVHGVQWQYLYFGWNMKTPWFADRRVRQAMSYAFDHREMLERLRYGMNQPSTGIFHPNAPWAPEVPTKPFQQDLDRAEELLDEAGWEDSDNDGTRDKLVDGKRVRFEFSMIVSPRQDRIDLCNLLRQNLEQIGVVCNIRQTEFTVMQEKIINHDYHAVCAGWGTGTDPDTLENLWGTGQQRNHGGYSNPEVDRLFKEGRKEFDLDKRRAIYGRIHTLIYEDQPYTWLFFDASMFGFNRNLRGYKFSPRGPYHYGPGIFSIWRTASK